jgi:hypothetical protein
MAGVARETVPRWFHQGPCSIAALKTMRAENAAQYRFAPSP